MAERSNHGRGDAGRRVARRAIRSVDRGKRGKPYSSPVLSDYGSVYDLTRGDTGGAAEPLIGETGGGT